MAAPIEILHVEDDPEIRVIVELSLGLDPVFSVVGAATAAEALTVLRDREAPPAAILLDFHIGETNGIDLLGKLRDDGRCTDVPAAFLTARIMPQDVEKMLAAGAIGVLTKPFNPVTLAQELRKLLGR